MKTSLLINLEAIPDDRTIGALLHEREHNYDHGGQLP